MTRWLLAWIGSTDLRGAAGQEPSLGPIANAVAARSFDRLLLLCNYPESDGRAYVRWLGKRTEARITLRQETLENPTEYRAIYERALAACEQARGEPGAPHQLTFHLSPGTPAMAAVWLLLAKTRVPAELIESSRERGVRTVEVPFDIAVDFLPELLAERDAQLRAASAAGAPEGAAFSDIIHRSDVMRRLVRRARKAALHNVPVLIEGESGTGKELLARAIHAASPRAAQPMLVLNCGAIPAELVESTLFGHERGAFTGADRARAGYFEEADGGSLFLDEIGELPAATQVKLLRVLQEGEVVRLGATRPKAVDVRVIAATNRSLLSEVASGRFREDLFFRLAVAVLKLPPLRDRAGDVGLLTDHLLAQVNREVVAGGEPKKLSAGARNLLLSHPWPGNVRELLNTLRRVVIWSDAPTITPDDVREALFPTVPAGGDGVLGRALGDGFELPELLADVARHYLRRALEDAAGNKTRAAELVGLPSYQTFTNWMERYGVRPKTS